MEVRKIQHLILLSVLIIFAFSACHARHVSDIRPNMTKQDVVSLWGTTDLITHKTEKGKAVETWEYHFAATDSICRITFIEERVSATQCRERPRYYARYYYGYPYPYRYNYPYYPYYYPYPPY